MCFFCQRFLYNRWFVLFLFLCVVVIRSICCKFGMYEFRVRVFILIICFEICGVLNRCVNVFLMNFIWVIVICMQVRFFIFFVILFFVLSILGLVWLFFILFYLFLIFFEIVVFQLCVFEKVEYLLISILSVYFICGCGWIYCYIFFLIMLFLW